MSINFPVLVVEDQPEVQRNLVFMLKKCFLGTEVQTANTLKEAIRYMETSQRFRLVLVDIGLPDGSGIDLIREIQAHFPDTPTVVATVYDDDENLFNALAAGARGYLLKEQDESQLLHGLRQFEQGQPALSPRIARRLLRHFHEQAPPAPDQAIVAALSPRETEVLGLIGRGLRVSEVAVHLKLAESTVSSYIKEIYTKLNISSRAQAALEAERRGLT